MISAAQKSEFRQKVLYLLLDGLYRFVNYINKIYENILLIEE